MYPGSPQQLKDDFSSSQVDFDSHDGSSTTSLQQDYVKLLGKREHRATQPTAPAKKRKNSNQKCTTAKPKDTTTTGFPSTSKSEKGQLNWNKSYTSRTFLPFTMTPGPTFRS